MGGITKSRRAMGACAASTRAACLSLVPISSLSGCLFPANKNSFSYKAQIAFSAVQTSLDLQQLSEFSLPQSHRSDRRGPVRWIASHTVRYWYLLVSMVVGALGNAALAAWLPIALPFALDRLPHGALPWTL